MSLSNLGLIYEIRGELDKAEEYYRRSLEMSKSVGATPMVLQVQKSLDDIRR